MFGLPKTHKEEVPLRPILSMVNAPLHAMARWLTEVLQPVVDKYLDHTIYPGLISVLFELCRV